MVVRSRIALSNKLIPEVALIAAARVARARWTARFGVDTALIATVEQARGRVIDRPGVETVETTAQVVERLCTEIVL